MVGVCVCVRVSMQARGERGVYVIMLCAAYAFMVDLIRACACGCLVHAYMYICMGAYACAHMRCDACACVYAYE